jgi:mannose-1-phosphate guanylyltransferase / mannose-6-phosphate isomerase
MHATPVIPVVMCGGRGARLWPLSTPEKPKVFHSLVSDNSMLQDTLLRCQGPDFVERPIIVGAARHAELIATQLSDFCIEADVVLEPYSRNSLPAALAGAMMAQMRAPGAIILLLAADHYIPDRLAFASAVQDAVFGVQNGQLVIFGVQPRYASDAFGYIQPGCKLSHSKLRAVNRFVEKPSKNIAQFLVAQGWLWNSGNFMCRADRLLDTAQDLVPDILARVRDAFASRANNILDPELFFALPALSFDRAIMENVQQALVCPVDYAWEDLGTWEAIIRLDAQAQSKPRLKV